MELEEVHCGFEHSLLVLIPDLRFLESFSKLITVFTLHQKPVTREG